MGYVNDLGVKTGDVFQQITGEAASDAAKDAARSQSDAQRTNVQESARQFEVTQATLQPGVEAGNLAREQQRILLGLGSGRTDPNTERRQELQSQLEGLQGQLQGQLQPQSADFGSGGIGSIMSRISQSQEPARQAEFQTQQADVQSQIDALTQELGGIPEFTQKTAQQEQEEAFQSFNESPGQKFLRDRGERATVRNAGAIGGLGGGNVRKALTEFGIGTAQQDFQNRFSRLGQLAGQGQGAATSLGQFGSNAVGQQAGFRTAGSEARASGIFGSQQAKAQGVKDTMEFAAQLGGAISKCDKRLKTDITELYRDELGGMYNFRYHGKPTVYRGRMAQELIETRPDAVITDHPSGFLHVTEEFKPEVVTCH